jgi:hypothetical protein
VPELGEHLCWGAWASVSAATFDRMVDLWEAPGREAEPPFFGWLSTELPMELYGATVAVPLDVVLQPVGVRPHLVVQDDGHPLAVEQRDGIPLARAREIAELVLHGTAPS